VLNTPVDHGHHAGDLSSGRNFKLTHYLRQRYRLVDTDRVNHSGIEDLAEFFMADPDHSPRQMKNHRATPEPPAWQVFWWFADMTHWHRRFGPWLASKGKKN
jgi:hypothetical protein